MDPNTHAVLTFLAAVQSAQERLSSLSYFDEKLWLLKPNGTRYPLTAWGTTHFNMSNRQDIVGEILIAASVNLRYAEAFYNNDRVESLAWHLELSWNKRSFVIAPRIIAYTDSRDEREPELLALPDRIASTSEDCLQELEQATEDLLNQRDIIYTLLGETN